MKFLKYSFLACAFLLIIIFLQHLTLKEKIRKCSSVSPVFLKSSGEIHDKYLVTHDRSIVYSINDSNNYSLKIYKDGETNHLFTNYKNVFNPILLFGEISAIRDSNSNEEFISTSSKLNEYIGSNLIKTIYSYNLGSIIILQLGNDNCVYLINFTNKNKIKLFEITQKLNGATFSEIQNYLIISYDDKLVYVNMATNAIVALADSLDGDKLNPYISDNYVYFVNNSHSEYYQVYKIDLLKLSNPSVQAVFQLDHDIRMPQIKGNYLYFIEVINSQYILKRLDLITQKIDNITFEGVVYNYEFYNDGKIIMAYSDFFNPRCLMIYNESDKSFTNISGSRVNHNLSFRLIKSSTSNSYAYELKPADIKIKGVVLFIHPGLNSDYSPRWEAVLMNLCNNGYLIIAPNFPMTCGYGKAFVNASVNEAIEDLIGWKNYLLKQYNNTPLFCLSISSSNILMQRLLLQDPIKINAAVSLFGIPTEIKKKSFSVPTLYILGENDPKVDFNNRYSTLHEEQKTHSTISIISYSDEGHWFRKKKNLQDAVSKIINYFCLYSD